MNENPDENPDKDPDKNLDYTHDGGTRPDNWTDEWEHALTVLLDDPGSFHSSKLDAERTFVEEFTYDVVDAYLDVNHMTRDEIAFALWTHYEQYCLRFPEEAAQ